MREHAPRAPEPGYGQSRRSTRHEPLECRVCGQDWPCATHRANEVLAQRWKVIDNDLIGGKCIVAENERLTPAQGAVSYIDLIFTDEIAQHIAWVHNEWVDGD